MEINIYAELDIMQAYRLELCLTYYDKLSFR